MGSRTAWRNIVITWCKEGFSNLGFLNCNRSPIIFRMNKLNLRFIVAYLNGFWDDDLADKLAGSDFFEEGGRIHHTL